MTDQELRDEIKKAQAGDTAARNRVLVASQGMIRTIVTKFAKSVHREDLIEDMCQEAIFGVSGKGGLASAISKYKTAGKETLSAFATQWILAECRVLILPSMLTSGQARNRSRKTRSDRKSVHGPAMKVAMAAGSIYEGSVTAMAEARASKFEERGLNEDYDILITTEPHANEEQLAAMIDGDTQKARFDAAIDSLDPEERFVLRSLAGTHGTSSTHQQIANQLGIHRLGVQKIVKRAIKKLKDHPLCRLTAKL